MGGFFFPLPKKKVLLLVHVHVPAYDIVEALNPHTLKPHRTVERNATERVCTCTCTLHVYDTVVLHQIFPSLETHQYC